MKVIPILGFLLIALSVPVLTFLGIVAIAENYIPTLMALEKERQKNKLNELNTLKDILTQSKRPDDQKVFEKIELLIDQIQKELERLERQLKAFKGQENAVPNNLPVQEQTIRLFNQTRFIFGTLNRGFLNGQQILPLVIRIVSLLVSFFVFLSILILSKFFKSRFLRSSLLTGALATLMLGVTSPIIALLLTLAILYTTRKIYEPLDCQTYA